MHVVGSAAHQDEALPRLTITAPDGTFDSRTDPQTSYELWVATPGRVGVEMNVREHDYPAPCSRRGASSFYAGRNEDSVEVTASDAQAGLAVRVPDLERSVEQNPCD